MEPAVKWARFFQNWPADIPQRGLMTTNLNELIPFKAFMLRDDLLLLERTNPDPSGSRFVLLGFETIDAVKLIDSVAEPVFAKMGFLGKLSTR